MPALERLVHGLDALVARLERVLVDVRVPGGREVRAVEGGLAERGVADEEDQLLREGRDGWEERRVGDEAGDCNDRERSSGEGRSPMLTIGGKGRDVEAGESVGRCGKPEEVLLLGGISRVPQRDGWESPLV